MQWTQEADLLLFKYLLQIHKITPDYKALAQAMGNGVTPKAVTHRIAKVRGLPASAAGCDENGPASPEKKIASPARVKKMKSAAGPMTPKGNGAVKREHKDDDEDENDGPGKGSPKSAKKIKV